MKYQTARQMIFEAYKTTGDSTLAGAIERARLGRDIQTSRRQNQDSRIAHGLEAGAVISRVESLPEHLQAMVRLCFGPFTREEAAGDRDQVQRGLYAEVMGSGLRLPGQGSDKVDDAALLRQLRWLCAAAIHHHTEATWPYRRPGLPTPQAVRAWLAEVCGVSLEGRWRQAGRASWHDIWEHCLRRLDQWEAQGLAPVSALLEEDRDARREEAV